MVLQPRVLLFDLAIGGHHASYIRHLIQYFGEQQPHMQVDVVVSPRFLDLHADVVQLAQPQIQFHAITAAEVESLKQRSLGKLFAEWNLLCHYARQLQTTQALLMYFDHLQLPLVFGQKAPCSVAGIYFRPTIHYDGFLNYTPTFKDRIRQWRQKRLLSLALQNAQLNVLFSLDPFAVSWINQLGTNPKATHLPDPVQMQTADPESVQTLRADLGIEPDRTVFLLFGTLDQRKGIYPLLESIRFLTEEQCKKICLLMVGRIVESEKVKLTALVAELAQSTAVQIIVQNQFVDESQVPSYYAVSDFVLAIYQKHVGMSGVLLQAAAAQKPVLSSDYGLMGELVRRYDLGLAIDALNPTAIAQAISRCLLQDSSTFANSGKMTAFVEQNLTEKYVDTLVSHLKLKPSESRMALK